MESIKPPKIIKVYQLLRQNGINFSNPGSASSMGIGFYSTLQEAEHNRTMEVLKIPSGSKDKFHIFELDIPNPAYEEN